MTGTERKACVIGWPVAHSLSPRLHNYWLKKYRIPGSYEAWEIKPENLAKAMNELRGKHFSGCNLTLPHKELVLSLLDSMDDTADSIGAANTIIIKPDGLLHGINTDAYGFIENIRSHASIIHKQKAVVLGAGGAARAIVKALMQEGFRNITLSNRTEKKSIALARHFAGPCISEPWQRREYSLENADLLVNTTSLGMKGNEPLSIDLSRLPIHAIVCDIVYSPLETDLLNAARARGNPAVDGLGMLIYQAVPAFEAWFGVRPEVTKETREALL